MLSDNRNVNARYRKMYIVVSRLWVSIHAITLLKLKNISKNLYFMMIKHMPNSKIILPKGLMKFSLGIPRVGNMYENVTQNKMVIDE